jgi:translation initiation factor 3 subunit H
VLEEIPVRVRTNALLSSFLGTLTEPHLSPLPDVPPSKATTSALPPSFSALNLGCTGLTKNLEQLIEAVDNYKTEEGNLAYLSRQITREKARAELYVTKRKEENVTRIAQGLAPLPEENVSRLFKIPPEPSRLESMLLLGQMDGYSQSLAVTSSTGLVTMYAAKASSGI